MPSQRPRRKHTPHTIYHYSKRAITSSFYPTSSKVCPHFVAKSSHPGMPHINEIRKILVSYWTQKSASLCRLSNHDKMRIKYPGFERSETVKQGGCQGNAEYNRARRQLSQPCKSQRPAPCACCIFITQEQNRVNRTSTIVEPLSLSLRG